MHSEGFHCYRLEYWRVFSISQAVVLRFHQVLWQMFLEGKKTLALSKLVSVLSGLAMILSDNFGMVAFAIAFSALSYNLESGTIEALAYDSLKSVRQEKKYNRYASTEMMLYRITSSTATLCAGFALWLGYKKAYAIDIFFGMIALGIVCSLREISGFTGADDKLINSQTDEYNKKQMSEEKQEWMNEEETDQKNIQNIRISERLQNVITESWHFMKNNRKARSIMIVNALIGAVSTLVLFFPAGKAATGGIERGTAWTGSFCHGTWEPHSAQKWWDIFQIGNTKSMLF